MLRLVYLLSFLLVTQIEANDSILCSHPQICNLLSMILPNNQLKSQVVFVGDHHHYEPSSSVVKAFIQAPILVTGPSALHPWLFPILKNRNNKNITITASIDLKFTELYKTKNQEALAHFWLYPEMACDFLTQYQNKLRKNKIAFNQVTEEQCLNKYKKPTEALVNAIQKNKLPIVLTHDALLPLFTKLNAKVLSLKGSGHHEEINPNAVKKLYDETKNTSVIWIQEEGFEIPLAIKKLIKKNDIVLELNPGGKHGDDVFEALNQIANKISASAMRKI